MQGIQCSAVIVSVLVLLERSMAYGVFEFARIFRASGPVFSMHIGGQHIDCYWSLALPFLLFGNRPGPGVSRTKIGTLLAVQALSIYAIFATMSRSTIAVAAGLVLVAFVAHGWARLPNRSTKWWGVLSALLMLTALVGMWFAGNAVQRRIATTRADLQTRMDHARDVGVLASQTNLMLCRGLATYPATYREYRGLSPSIPRIQSADAAGNPSGVLIEPDCLVYLEQLVDVGAPSPWHVRLRYSTNRTNTIESSSPPARLPLSVMVCEKTLLQSFECVRATGHAGDKALKSPTESGSSEINFDLELSKMNRRKQTIAGPLTWRPVTLTVMAHGKSPVLLHSIGVLDADGNAVILNGDFQQGSRHWFFTAGDHLVWRTQSLMTAIRRSCCGQSIAGTPKPNHETSQIDPQTPDDRLHLLPNQFP